jgi:hypothetical protein
LERRLAPAATQLLVNVQPPGIVSAGFGFEVKISALTSSFVVDPTFTGSVTLSFASGGNPGNATLGGKVTLNAVKGVADFKGISVSKPFTSQDYELQAASTGLTSTTTNFFQVRAKGAATHLVVTTQPPATIAAGSSFGMVVKAEDSFGTVDTHFSDNPIRVQSFFGALGGATAVPAIKGVATFSGLSLDRSGSLQSLYVSTFEFTVPEVQTKTFTVTPGPVTHLTITGFSSNVLTNATFSLDLSAEDRFGNIIPSFKNTVTLALKNNTSGATFGGTLQEKAVNGFAGFFNLTIDKAGAGYVIQASGGGFTASTAPFDVNNQLVITSQPASGSSFAAGTAFGGLTVTVEDGLGNTLTSFNGKVSVNTVGTSTVSAVSGVATFSNMIIDQAGTFSLTVTSPGCTPATTGNEVTITPLAATHLVVQDPFTFGGTDILPDSSFVVDVAAEDQFGNLDTNFSGSITVALVNNPTNATLGGTLTQTAFNGGTFSAEFSDLTINTPGLGYTLQASATGLTSGTSNPFDVIDQIVITSQPPSSVAVGAPFGLTAAVEDGNFNVDTSFSGLLSVDLNFGAGNLGGELLVAANAGVATFSGLTVDQAGQYLLRVFGPNLSDGFTDVVQATQAPRLTVTTQPSVVTAGAPFPVTITALDGNGNVDFGFSGNVTLSLGNNPGGGKLSGTTSVAVSSGVATFSSVKISAPGKGYTLQASASGFLAAATTAFDVTPVGIPNQLVVTTQPPGTVTAGQAFGMTVKAEDAFGTVDTHFSGSVTVSVAGGGTVSGTATVNAVNGVATFTNLQVDQAGATNLSITAGSLTATSNSITVNPAPATQLVVSAPSNAVLTGAPFEVFVDAEDPFGNTDANFTGNITLSLSTNPGSATLGGNVALAATAGEADFTTLTMDQTGTGYVIQADALGLTSGQSPAFDVTGDQFIVTAPPPANIPEGGTFGLQVTAVNGAGNVDTSFSGSVALTLNDLLGSGGTLSGTATATATSGVATFSGLSINVTGSYTLAADSSGVAEGVTAPFNVTATQLQVTEQPPTAVTAGAGFSLQITAEDPSGNVDPNFSGPVSVALSNNPNGATLGGPFIVSAVNGVADFSGLTLNLVGSGYTLQATSEGLTPITTAAFDTTPPRVASQLVVSAQPPATLTAGQTFSVTVQAEDGLGTVDTTFQGAVTLAADNGGAIAGNVTVNAVNGVAVFPGLSLTTAGIFTLDASADGVSDGVSNSVTVNPAAATQLSVVGPSGNILAATPFGIEVDAVDPFGNVDPSFSGIVTVALAANASGTLLGGTVATTAENGVALFTGLTINVGGSGYVITAASTGLSGASSAPFDATQDQFVVTTPPPATVTAATPFSFAVSAMDGFGNVDTSFNGKLTVSLSDQFGTTDTLGGKLTVAATNGVATFSGLTLYQAGMEALTVTATGIATGTTDGFSVAAAAATHLVVTTEPPDAVTAGAPFEVDISALDPFGNADTNFSGTISLAILNNPSSGALGGTASMSATNGVAAFTGLSINNAGNGYTLQATSTSLLSATTDPLDITAVGVATELVVTTEPPSSVTAGGTFGLVAQAEDSFGTVDSTFNGEVTLSDPVAGVIGVTGAQSGVATFAGLTIDQAGVYDLSATAGALAAGEASALTVNPGSATQLSVAAPSSNVLPGAPFDVQVVAVDPFGNVDPNFGGQVTMALASNPGTGTLGGTLTVNAANGLADFPNLTLSAAGNGFTLQATSGTLVQATSPAFNVTANQFVVTTQPPASVAAGGSFGLVVAAENAAGIVDKTFTGNVQLTITNVNNAGVSTPIAGKLTLSAVGGVATFSGLSVAQAGSYGLTASATGVGAAVTNSFDVAAAAASVLQVTAQPPSITAGAGFTMVVTALDSFGNVATAFNGNVTLAFANNAGSGHLGGTLIVAAAGGIATFTGITIDTAANGYTLTATSSGLVAATSSAFNVTPPGVATQLVVTTQPPASLTAGQTFGLVVEAEDSFGTLDTGFTGNVTLTLTSTGGTGGSLGGTAMLAASGGVANFSGLSIDLVGAYTLSASGSANLVPTTTDTINISADVAFQLGFGSSAQTLTAGVPSAAITAEVQDRFGNETFAPSSLVVTLGTSSSGTFQDTGGNPITSVTIAQGASTAVFVYKDTLAGTPTLTLSGSLASGTQQETIVAAPATQLAMNFGPTVAAGTFQVTVTALDPFGNTDLLFNGSATLSLSGGPAGTTLAGSTSAPFHNGVAAFSNLSLTVAGSYQLVAASTSDLVASGALAVVPGTLAGFSVSGIPATDVSGAANSVKVTAEDAFGNIITSYNGTVQFSVTGNGGTPTLPGPYTFNPSTDKGAHTFAGVVLNLPGSNQTLTVTDSSANESGSAAVTVVSPATHLSVSIAPGSQTAGQPVTVTVRALDAANSLDPFFGDTLQFASTDPLVPAVQLPFTGNTGSATFPITLETAGSQTITVTDVTRPGVASDKGTITITAAALASLGVTGLPSPDATGAAHSVTVTALDQFGNTVTSYAGTVQFSVSGNGGTPTLPSQYTFVPATDKGSHTFTNVILNLPGSGQTLTVTDNGGKSGSEAVTVVSPTTHLTVIAIASQTAGAPVTVTVTALDAANHTDSLFADTLQFTSTDPRVVPVELPFAGSNGTATFQITLKTAGTQTITVSDVTNAGVIGGKVKVTIKPDKVAAFTVTGFPTSDVLNAVHPFKVTAVDRFGNIAVGFTGQIQFSVGGGGTGTLPANYIFKAKDKGSHTFSAALTSIGPGQSIDVSDTASSATGSETDINVLSPATHLGVFVSPTSQIAGQVVTVTVSALDAANHVDAAFADTVKITSSDAKIQPLFVSFAGSNGTVTFSVIPETAGTQTVIATDVSRHGVAAGSAGINVSADSNPANTVLVVSGFPSPDLPGAAHSVTVAAEDEFGNHVTTYRGIVSLSVSGSQTKPPVLPGPFTFTAASKGSHTFSGVILNTVGTFQLTAQDTSGLSASETVDVTQLTAAIAGVPGNAGVPGQPVSVTFSANETGAAPGAVFTYSINWGGKHGKQIVTGANSVTVSHVFQSVGNQTVTVTVTDSAGNTSAPVTQAIAIQAAALIVDPADNTKTALAVVDVAGNETIVITPATTSSGATVKVSINGVALPGSFTPTGPIIVYGNGSDTINLVANGSQKVTIPAIVFAGSGKSATISAAGSSANNALVGGGGSDTVTAGAGNDILIGGSGAASLTAGAGSDILLGGSTSYDAPTAANVSALLALLAEWGSTDAYLTRVQDLFGTGSGGANGATLLNFQRPTAVDQLFGNASAMDWFWFSASPTATGKVAGYTSGEIATAE